MLATLRSLFFSAQFGRFLLFGGLAAALQWSSRFAFDVYFSYSISVILAYGVGLSCGFILNRAFVFQAGQTKSGHQLAYFVLINLAGLPLVWWLSLLLGEQLLPRFMMHDMAKALGNGMAILSPVAINFILHKFVTFQTSKR
jgi:putative flippase GtrA